MGWIRFGVEVNLGRLFESEIVNSPEFSDSQNSYCGNSLMSGSQEINRIIV